MEMIGKCFFEDKKLRRSDLNPDSNKNFEENKKKRLSTSEIKETSYALDITSYQTPPDDHGHSYLQSKSNAFN